MGRKVRRLRHCSCLNELWTAYRDMSPLPDDRLLCVQMHDIRVTLQLKGVPGHATISGSAEHSSSAYVTPAPNPLFCSLTTCTQLPECVCSFYLLSLHFSVLCFPPNLLLCLDNVCSCDSANLGGRRRVQIAPTIESFKRLQADVSLAFQWVSTPSFSKGRC